MHGREVSEAEIDHWVEELAAVMARAEREHPNRGVIVQRSAHKHPPGHAARTAATSDFRLSGQPGLDRLSK
ncbi:hypothetical protein GCM10023063_21960 [Arthrobacter methylotrophus]